MVRCILSNVGYHEHGSDKNNFTCRRRARKRQKKVHNHNVRCGERQLSKKIIIRLNMYLLRTGTFRDLNMCVNCQSVSDRFSLYLIFSCIAQCTLSYLKPQKNYFNLGKIISVQLTSMLVPRF
jgi:hypothetical protein